MNKFIKYLLACVLSGVLIALGTDIHLDWTIIFYVLGIFALAYSTAVYVKEI